MVHVICVPEIDGDIEMLIDDRADCWILFVRDDVLDKTGAWLLELALRMGVSYWIRSKSGLRCPRAV